MPKGEAESEEGGEVALTEATIKRTSASKKAVDNQSLRLAASSNKNNKMKAGAYKPLMNPNALKIGKKKMRKGR
jgi:hypothetical protein